MSVISDYEFCREIIKSNSKSFFKAFSTLPKEKANAIYAVYTFCRYVDDLVDKGNESASLLSFIDKFQAFSREEDIEEPLWRALRHVFSNYEMDYQPFEEMIQGQLRDTVFVQPTSQSDLEEYCYYVAGTVGLMILPILSANHKALKSAALKLGTAMQLTNILRDIGEDYSIGRVYLPLEVLKRYNYSIEDLKHKLINSNFIELWEYEASRAEQLYAEALEDFYYFNEDAIFAVLIAANLYRDILRAVRKNHYDCFNFRAYVPKLRRYSLVLKSYMLKRKIKGSADFISINSRNLSG